MLAWRLILLTGRHIRAARALIGWGQDDLAAKAKVACQWHRAKGPLWQRQRGHGATGGWQPGFADGAIDSHANRRTNRYSQGGRKQKHGRGGDSSVCDKLLSLH